MIPHQILQEPPANLQASLRCIPLADLSELHYHQLIIIIILSYLDVGSRQYLNSPLQLLSEFPEHEKAEWKIFFYSICLFIHHLFVAHVWMCACYGMRVKLGPTCRSFLLPVPWFLEVGLRSSGLPASACAR